MISELLCFCFFKSLFGLILKLHCSDWVKIKTELSFFVCLFSKLLLYNNLLFCFGCLYMHVYAPYCFAFEWLDLTENLILFGFWRICKTYYINSIIIFYAHI